MRWGKLVAFLAVVLLAVIPAQAGAIRTRDGNIYRGEIKFLDSGKLVVRHDGTSTTLAATDIAQLSMRDPSKQSVHGLIGEYFQGGDFTDPKGKRIDPVMNVNWPPGAEVIKGIPNDHYTIRWTGQIQPRYSQQYTFSTVNDDDVRLWINNQKVLESWTGSRGEAHGQIALEAGRRYDIRIDFANRQGDGILQLSWASPSQPQEIVPTQCLFANAAGTDDGVGLRGQYFSNREMRTVKVTRIDPMIYCQWHGAPDPSLEKNKYFAVRWSGLIRPRYSGSYTFSTHCNGGVKLLLDGTTIIDEWKYRATPDHTGAINLEAGKKVDITMDYCYSAASAASTTPAFAELQWASDKQQRQYVPKECLFPDTLTAANEPKSEFDTLPPAPSQGLLLTDGSTLQAVPAELDLHGPNKMRWGQMDLTVPARRIAVLFRDGSVLDPGWTWPADTGVLMRNGDFLEGSIQSIKWGNVNVSSILFGLKGHPLGDLRAVLFQKPVRYSAAFTVRCIDGSAFAATALTIKSNAITIETDSLGPLTIAADEIFSIQSGK